MVSHAGSRPGESLPVHDGIKARAVFGPSGDCGGGSAPDHRRRDVVGAGRRVQVDSDHVADRLGHLVAGDNHADVEKVREYVRVDRSAAGVGQNMEV